MHKFSKLEYFLVGIKVIFYMLISILGILIAALIKYGSSSQK